MARNSKTVPFTNPPPAKFRARIKKDWPQIRLKADGPGPAGGHAFVLVKIDPTEN